MKTNGVGPEAFAASISLLSRSEMDVMPSSSRSSGRSSDPSEPTTNSPTRRGRWRSSGRARGQPRLLLRAEEVLELLVWCCRDRECDGDASSTPGRAGDLDRAAERLDS